MSFKKDISPRPEKQHTIATGWQDASSSIGLNEVTTVSKWKRQSHDCREYLIRKKNVVVPQE
jgi:hypothetical protein